ncbi:MAG: nuclear transport factor 2 family protein [Ignavibacteria bacterium]|nr:nuclear transport factor 2 family protein [Ignavibacteria bacterium]
MKQIFAVLFSAIFLSSLVYAQDMSELKKKVQMMNDKYAEQMVGGDMSTLWDYYSDDIISMPSYEPMLKGLEACKKSAQKMEESGMKITAFSTTSTDVMQSGNLVVDIGTYNITMQVPGMDMPWDDHGKYLNIWEMQDDGSMKMKVETWNTDVNPWMEMEKMEGHDAHEGHMEMQEDKDVK